MALLQWFTRPKPADDAVVSEGGHEVEGVSASRKSERTARRELLYAVVRECMLKAGVLSGQYRFKVLSLDKRGRKSLLMVDLEAQLSGGSAQLGQIEQRIVETARARDDLGGASPHRPRGCRASRRRSAAVGLAAARTRR